MLAVCKYKGLGAIIPKGEFVQQPCSVKCGLHVTLKLSYIITTWGKPEQVPHRRVGCGTFLYVYISDVCISDVCHTVNHLQLLL